MNKDYIKCIDVFKIVNIGVIYKTKYYFFSQTCSKKENLIELHGFMVIISI